jgi:glycosyltransferase involved in cell wall biosynthesis
MPIRLSVVVPFYNEVDCAQALAREIAGTLQRLSSTWELVLVNDGSTDGTEASLYAFAAGHPTCRVLTLNQNSGQAAALLVGMRAAIGDIIITMDGDGQNVPADIPALLTALEKADMVVGIRQNRQDSGLRRRISRLANAVRSRVLRDGVRDSGCALKAFRREVVGALIPLRTLYSFMPAMAAASGFTVIQIPVQHRARQGGCSSYGLFVFLWRPLLDMLGMWWFTRRCVQLKRASYRSHVAEAARPAEGKGQ